MLSLRWLVEGGSRLLFPARRVLPLIPVGARWPSVSSAAVTLARTVPSFSCQWPLEGGRALGCYFVQRPEPL